MKGRTVGNAPRHRQRHAKPYDTLHVVLVPVPAPVPAERQPQHKKAGGAVHGRATKPRLDKRARAGDLPLHRDLGGFIGKVPQSAWLGLGGCWDGHAGGAPIGRALGTGAAIGRLVHGPRSLGTSSEDNDDFLVLH
jgi:hypothetical protein